MSVDEMVQWIKEPILFETTRSEFDKMSSEQKWKLLMFLHNKFASIHEETSKSIILLDEERKKNNLLEDKIDNIQNISRIAYNLDKTIKDMKKLSLKEKTK